MRVNRDNRGHLFALERDWEWKDASEVFNSVHGADVFSVEMLKRDYAATMMAVKGEVMNAKPRTSPKLRAMIRALCESDGRAALAIRTDTFARRITQEPQDLQRRAQDVTPSASDRGRKRTNSRSSADTLRRCKHARREEGVGRRGHTST